METRNYHQPLVFLDLFKRFINDSRRGKRLQPNGKRLSPGTIQNYNSTLRVLKFFNKEKNFDLRIWPVSYLDKEELAFEKNHWKKFYKLLTDYLYDDCGYFDNYAGIVFKNIKVFFNYLNKELALGIGDFHKSFYVRKEEIAIFPLLPEELNYLIYDKEFETRLTKRMKEVKDFFVFGCTVALRFSDLVCLRKSNVRVMNGQHYLVTRSIKTNAETLIKLPQYAIEIMNRYYKKKTLLPKFNKSNLNKFIKRLLEHAEFTHPVLVTRSRRGIPIEIKAAQKPLRFCDVATTHTMRRTAITTLLSLGMPEQVVRKISGHSPSGKEFYRYVFWAQTYQDGETEKVFERLQEKRFA